MHFLLPDNYSLEHKKTLCRRGSEANLSDSSAATSAAKKRHCVFYVEMQGFTISQESRRSGTNKNMNSDTRGGAAPPTI